MFNYHQEPEEYINIVHWLIVFDATLRFENRYIFVERWGR